MMWDVRIILVPVLLATAMTCGNQAGRSSVSDRKSSLRPPIIGGAIDWSRSAGVFIGIERFRKDHDAPLPVQFASDDATDLAYFFAIEKALLPPAHTTLIVAGRPNKADSQEHLEDLSTTAAHVLTDSINVSIDEAAIVSAVGEQAQNVKKGGVLILFIATHGFTTPEGRHILLTPDASMHDLKGPALTELLHAIPAEHAGRVFVFIDACRTKIDPEQPAPDPRGATPLKLLEELNLPGNYAVFVAARAGEFAGARDGNGNFSKALLEALGCTRSAAGPDHYITPASLDEYLTKRVSELSHDSQRPDARFAGLGAQPFLACRPPDTVGEIVSPKEGDIVPIQDRVKLRVALPDLRATVLICGSFGQCFNANPGQIPAPAAANCIVPVQYGTAAEFQLWVALSADPAFLRNQTNFPSLPVDVTAQRIVYWLGPVNVTAAEIPDQSSNHH